MPKKVDQGEGYSLYLSEAIIDLQNECSELCEKVFRKFDKQHPHTNPTASTTEAELSKYNDHSGYLKYNFFSLCAPSMVGAILFQQVHHVLRENIQDEFIYVQCWLNRQLENEVLGWHSHEGYDYHGYVCIDPKNSETDFGFYKISNQVGLIYFASEFPQHRVRNLSPFSGHRLTIGFDVVLAGGPEFENKGFVPVVLR